MNEFCEEVFAYFKNRGWEGQELIYLDSGDRLSIRLSYFWMNKNMDKAVYWSEITNIYDFLKYCKWFLHHIKSIWEKHNMGSQLFYFSSCSLNIVLFVDEKCAIHDYKLLPKIWQ